MLSDEEVAGIKWCYGGSGCDDCPTSTCVGAEETIVAALLSDRAELVAEIERLRAVVEAARELMAARGPHIEGSVPLKNALAALEVDSHA